MSTINWPQNVIPWSPYIESWGKKDSDAVTRTDWQSGPSRTRSRYTNPPSTHTFQLTLTPDQFAYFEAFWADTLLYGAYWFNMPVMTPLGKVTVEMKFQENPDITSQQGFRYIVPFNVLIRKWPRVSGVLVYVLDTYGASFIDILDKLDPVVNLSTSIPGWPWAARNHNP